MLPAATHCSNTFDQESRSQERGPDWSYIGLSHILPITQTDTLPLVALEEGRKKKKPHSFSNYLFFLSVYYRIGTVLGTVNTAVNQTNEISACISFTF